VNVSLIISLVVLSRPIHVHVYMYHPVYVSLCNVSYIILA